VQRIVATNAIQGEPKTRDLIEVECVKAPDGWWQKAGDRESNCAWRYEYFQRAENKPTDSPP
jgi:hypothetical protein